MQILLTGNKFRRKEFRHITPDKHEFEEYNTIEEGMEDRTILQSYDLIVDLNFDDNILSMRHYAPLENNTVVVSAVKKQLADMVFTYEGEVLCDLIGINALPTFINRPKLEVSLLDNDSPELIEPVAEELEFDYELVDDRAGMVMPRILFMIINEACYTLQEGTASINDIDKAMKLGTAYPYGPFEWADRIGIKNVYETLRAVYEHTRDERYRICPLLRTKYLRGTQFYA
jgi:3-hydroxybutyryl-CoA dehydrogenase